jgi:hypothetical protein
MTATFTDFVAYQDACNTIQLNVTKWSLMLCDALKQNYIDYSIRHHQRSLETYHQEAIKKLKNGECDYDFVIESGRKYHKIIMVIDNGSDRSPSHHVHAFIDKKTGEVYKSATTKSPAKGVRYDLRIIEQREWLLQNASWCGGYLYIR